MEDVRPKIDRAFQLLGTDADAVLIVPPFAALDSPHLGVHLLQAAAERAGFRVRILYANLLFARVCGEQLYDAIRCADYRWMWGERIFSAAAFGLPHLGYEIERIGGQIASQPPEDAISFEQLTAVANAVEPFCNAMREGFATLHFRVAGATSSFQQTAASFALLSQARRARSQAVTIIGGANCEGVMAQGIASLGDIVDYIFSGESDSSFPEFLQRLVSGTPLPMDRIINGEPCFRMDDLAEPCFDDYFAQLENAFPERAAEDVWLPYESSRGCWWGARQHCTFCGLNDETMAFREKSPNHFIASLKRLFQRYPNRRLCMVDNIFPFSYYRTVLPRLARELPSARLFYEAKSNINLEQAQALRQSGVDRIQSGIESLSSSLLRRMKKGALARQNVALLRYARATGLSVTWSLLYDFPGDSSEDYEETLALMPLLHHLSPPAGLIPLYLVRFSPYVNNPEQFGISGVAPVSGYACAFPRSADLNRLAYNFTGDYSSTFSSHPELYARLQRGFSAWRDCWRSGGPPPALSLARGRDGYFTLTDTRGLEGTSMLQFLNEDQARTVLVGGPLERQPLADWAIDNKLAVALDGWCVPLAVTDVETWRHFESGSHNQSLLIVETAAVNASPKSL